ncbi:hypothetical protein MN608_10391 [Microdochium nivale]|nr:hypothetical protein MN608_10391 [Microdochium nivale]
MDGSTMPLRIERISFEVRLYLCRSDVSPERGRPVFLSGSLHKVVQVASIAVHPIGAHARSCLTCSSCRHDTPCATIRMLQQTTCRFLAAQHGLLSQRTNYTQALGIARQHANSVA